MAVRYEEVRATPRRNPILSFAREHITLVGSGIAALIFAIRCVAITKGDTHTASILLANTSLGDAIRALLFFVLPTMLVTLAYGLIIAAGLSIPPSMFLGFWRFFTTWSARKPLGLLAAGLIASVLGGYLSGRFAPLPWWDWDVYSRLVLFPMWFLSIGFAVAVRRFASRRKSRVGSVIFSLCLLAWIVFLFVGLIRTIHPLRNAGDFWLPREHLIFEHEENHLIGYVLKESGDHFVILNDDPRIIIEKKGPLQDRDFCYPRNKGYEEAFKEAGQERDMIICW